MTPGERLKAWRAKQRLSLEKARDVIGVNFETLRQAELGAPIRKANADRIHLATGIRLPVSEVRGPKPAEVVQPDDDDESDLRGRHCWHCCGLPHRRPQSKPCRCGESWAPDIVQHPVPGLSSSASWCGDFAESKDSDA